MRHVLGIETATDICSVALGTDGEIVRSITLDRPRRHAERLVPMIDDLLRSARLRPGSLDAIAVSAGPGSYTGLRIGVSTAKGIALATGAWLVPVPTLTALASSAPARGGALVVAALDSRQDEVFAAAFRLEADGTAAPLGDPIPGTPREVLTAMSLPPDEPVVTCGPGRRLVARAARDLGLTCLEDSRIRPSASAVVQMARLQPAGTDPVDLDSFEPYYLREFAARPARGTVFDRLPF